jgi:two-component system chemotaxis sensor kinase CheA
VLRDGSVNEFLEQFLIEGCELVEQATEDLLALEEAPGDRARLDSAFRGFHTLKGVAGIVEFAAMSRVLHAPRAVWPQSARAISRSARSW